MNDSVPLQKTKILRVKVDLDTAGAFDDLCKNEGTNVNAKLKELVDDALKGQKQYFLAGRNRLAYDKVHNSFEWLVQLESGQEISILSDLSDNFLKDLQQEIEHAIRERNEWIHHAKSDSIDIPKTLVRHKNGA